MSNIAWWFAASDVLPRGDGRRVVIGERLRVDPPLVLCGRGLHWSRHPFDALQFAPGSLLYQVQPGGEIIEDSDKGCSTERTALAVRDATEMLRAFARAEARRVLHLWDAPEIVRRFLDTGDESIWAAARDAARAATWPTASALSRDATWAATWDAASAAARDATRAATWATAWDADWDAARATARAAARDRFAAAVAALFEERDESAQREERL